MRNIKLYSTMRILVLLLCSFYAARGQTPIPITASQNPVCRDATAQYTAPRTATYTYVWTVTPQGNAGVMTLTTTTTGIPVNWVSSGTAVVTVKGYNSASILKEQGTLNITVLPRPAPYITLDTRVGCQNLEIDTPKREGGQPPPKVDDETENCIKTCENSQTIFTAHGAAGSTYTWSVTGGTISATSATTCTVNWGAAGPGSITVTETTVNGCVGTKTNCIEIIHSPKARFFGLPDSTVQDIKVCLNQNIVFVDRSSPGNGSPLVTWLWDFGDGTTTTATSGAPITHSYNQPGSYVVILTVINQCNCRSTYKMKVYVSPQEGVKIECPSVVCEGTRATYTVDANCGSYNWSVSGGTIISGAGTPSIEVVWNQVDASGFGYVYFDNSGNCNVACPGITVIKVPVIQKVGTIDGPAFTCANKSVLYRMPQWPTTTFNWTVTGGTGATLSTTDQRNEILLNTQGGGTVTLACTYYNTLLKCGGQASITVTISQPPTLSGPAKACTGTGTTYTSSVAGNWSMTTPGGSTVAGPSGVASWNPNFTAAGIYRIRLTGNFCSPEPLIVAVKAPPAAPDSLLGPSSACTGTPTLYTAKNAMTGTLFVWSAGSTTALNATSGNTTYATFSGGGPNVITLQRAWADLPGCLSAPLTKSVTRPPGAPVVAGDILPCANSYKPYNAGPFLDADNYQWEISPGTAGSVSTGQGTANVTVLWNNVAVNTPALVILRARRCDSVYVDTLAVVISGIPTIAIVPANSTVCANVPVAFSVTPAVSGTYSWDLGQTTSTLTSPTYAYQTTSSTNANYNVSVTINNANGCPGSTAIATTNITVKPAPVGSLSPAGTYVFCGAGNINLPAQLTANAQSGFGGPVTTVNWYQNGTLTPPPSGSGQPAFTFGTVSQFGSYYAVLTSANGCSSNTDTMRVIQNCGPGCTVAPGYTVTTTNVSQGCGTAVINSSWTAGGSSQQWSEPSGNSSVTNIVNGTNNSTITYAFNQPGHYTVTSAVAFPAVGGGSCLAARSASFIIPYLANLRTKITCAGSSYNVNLLDNSVFYPGTPIQSYQLYNGSGTLINSSSTATNVNLTGMAPGSYTYTLVISRTGYAACTTTATINLPGIPAVTSLNPSRANACINDAVTTFTPIVTPAGLYSYLWTFGDGSSNTQQNVAKVYSSPFNSIMPYPVSLTVTNLYGCTASASATVNVVADNLSGGLLQTPNFPCEGQIVNLYYNNLGSSTPTPSSYTWYQPLNTTALTASGSSLNVTDPGAFFVKVEDAFGCTFSTPVASVNFLRVPTPVITGDTDQCDQVAFTLNGNVGPGNYTYNWYLNGGLVQSSPSYELQQSGLSPGTYTYTLTVTALNPPAGTCQKTSQPFVVTVHGLPPAPWINPPSPLACSPYVLQLSAGASVPGTFNWSNGMSNSPITVYSGGDYRVYFTDTFGCSSKANRFIPRDPNSYLWIFPTGCYVLCPKDFPFQLVGPQASFNYWAWMYNGNPDLDGYNSFVAPYNIQQDGLYNLLLNNGLCTVKSDDMDVKITDEGCERGPVIVDCDIRVDLKESYGKIEEERCKWYVYLSFNNPYGMNVPYQITSSVGYAVPASGVLSPSSSMGNLYQMVFPASFTGGVVTLTITFDLGKGQYCTKEVRFEVKPCDGRLPWGKMAPPGSGEGRTAAAPAVVQTNSLTLAPNPAANTVSIGYRTTSINNTLEVYDVLSRKVASQAAAAGEGSWSVDVSAYVPGIYQVVLRSAEGKVLLHQALSVQH